jgi:sugar phosphate permease
MSELRLTETNSAEDSAGKTWGLEGSLFWYLIGGVFTSVIMLLLLFSVWRWTFVASLASATVPLTLVLLYIFGLRQGKPPGYDRDLLELWLSGPGFGPQPRKQ